MDDLKSRKQFGARVKRKRTDGIDIEFSSSLVSAQKSHQRPTRAKRLDLAIIPYETPGCYIIQRETRRERRDIHFGCQQSRQSRKWRELSSSSTRQAGLR